MEVLSSSQSAEAIKELQNELIILMEELKAVSIRNEELLAERDEDAEVIRQLEADVTEYKRKWDTTRTQLRNLKGELQLSFADESREH
jgi:chromosome segregation ATPase